MSGGWMRCCVGLAAWGVTGVLSGCQAAPSAATQPARGQTLATQLALGQLEAVDQAIWELSLAEPGRAGPIRASLSEALARIHLPGRVGPLAHWWQTRRPAIGRQLLAFQGLRAYDHLVKICEFGPRPSGSPALQRMQAFLVAWFSERGARVRRQAFTYADGASGQDVPMVNVIASLGPDTSRRLLLGTHIDTRRWADEEPDTARRHEPVIGANDGASGAAVLLELAEILTRYAPRLGVDLVFFDGEEYAPKGSPDYFLGSKHFAAQYRTASDRPTYVAAVVLDMVGGKRLRLPREPGSTRGAPHVVEEIWDTARALGHRAFVPAMGEPIEDDHVALCEAGIPAVLLIDFSDVHRHRPSDVPARCDPASLRAVGQVLTRWIYRQPRPM